MLTSPADTGGGGGTSIFPSLPPGTPGYVYVVVGFVIVFGIAATLVVRYFPARERPTPPGTTLTAGGEGVSQRLDVQVLRETIERLDRDLAKANEAVEAAELATARWQKDYYIQHDKASALERALSAMRTQMSRCHDEVTRLRAQMELLRAPLHADQARPPIRDVWAPSSAPVSAPGSSRPLVRPVHDDDPTDPIPGAPR